MTTNRLLGLCLLVLSLLLLATPPVWGQPGKQVEGAPGPARVIRLPASANRNLMAFGGEGRYAIAVLDKIRQVVIVDLVEEKIKHYIPSDPAEVCVAADRSHLYVYDNSTKVMQKIELESGKKVAQANVEFGSRALRLAAGSYSDGPVYVAAENRVYAVDAQTLSLRENKDLAAIKPAYLEHVGNVFNTSPDGSALALTGATWPVNKRHHSTEPRFFQIRNDRVTGRVDLERVQAIYPIEGGDYFTTDRFYDFTGNPESPYREARIFPLETLNLAVVLHRPSHLSPPALLIELFSGRPLLQMGDLTQVVAISTSINVGGPPSILTYAAPARALAYLDSEGQSIVLYPCDFEAQMRRLDFDFLYVASLPVTRGRPGQPYRYQLDVRSRRGGAIYRMEEGPQGMVVQPDGVVSWDIPEKAELPVRVKVIVQDASGQETFQSYRIFGE